MGKTSLVPSLVYSVPFEEKFVKLMTKNSFDAPVFMYDFLTFNLPHNKLSYSLKM